MSSSTNSKTRRDYVLTSDGPINIRGVLKRKGDPAQLNVAEAKSYAAHVKRVRKPKTDTSSEAPKVVA